MIRKLCFLQIISFLMFCGTSNANIVIDNFDVLTMNFGAPSAAVDRGSGGVFTSTLELSRSVGTLDIQFGSEAYVANDFQAGDMFTLSYADFTALSGGGATTLGNATGMANLGGLILPIAPVPFNEWRLEIKGTGFVDQTFNPVGGTGLLTFAVPGLSNASNIQLKFTKLVDTLDEVSLTYGGLGLDSTAIVPEPTTLMMYGSLVFLGLTVRRRRR